MIDLNTLLKNIIVLLEKDSTVLMILLGITLFAYLLSSFLLGRIFAKAGQSLALAFVPVVNIIIFYRLGGYSPLWIIAVALSDAYLAVISLVPIFAQQGESWATTGIGHALLGIAPVGVPLAGLLTIAATLVGLLSAYNIGRAFERDAGYLLLFLFLPIIWLIALAFTAYDWDESAANPNSIGTQDRSNARAAQARETAKNKERSARFMEPVAPTAVKQAAPESDYDRALRMQQARGGVPAQKRGKKSADDPGNARIVDAGSTGADTNSDWF